MEFRKTVSLSDQTQKRIARCAANSATIIADVVPTIWVLFSINMLCFENSVCVLYTKLGSRKLDCLFFC